MESSESTVEVTEKSVLHENSEFVQNQDPNSEKVLDSAPTARHTRPTVRHRPGDSKRLRARIVAMDISAAFLSWTFGTFLTGNLDLGNSKNLAHFGIGLATFISTAFLFCYFLALYRTRVSFVPSVERSRIFLAGVGSGLIAGVIYQSFNEAFFIEYSIIFGLLYFVFDATLRSLFRHWLRIQRSNGRYHKEILLIGTNADAMAMYELLRTHPEVGFTIVGVIGDKKESDSFDDIAWCGHLDEIVDATRKTGATGVIVAANALEVGQLRHVTNKLLSHSIHVHLSSGLFGFDERRLRPQSFSREPVFYVEPISFPVFQRAIKRVMDITISGALLLVAAPIMAVAGLFIKLDDRGPVLFHQTRIGRDSLPFRCIKLRTMSVDAEKNLNKLMKENERRGPLFKHSSDPRRTTIGKFLEATSLDELPQLWLVFKGTMSLIGPRPALPHEVAVFDEDLKMRHLVRPGITGLWQVEGRDNPSFDAYRRLDLFYVENWSLFLDLSIVAMTVHVVISRAFRKVFSRKRPDWLRAGVVNPGADTGE